MRVKNSFTTLLPSDEKTVVQEIKKKKDQNKYIDRVEGRKKKKKEGEGSQQHRLPMGRPNWSHRAYLPDKRKQPETETSLG